MANLERLLVIGLNSIPEVLASSVEIDIDSNHGISLPDFGPDSIPPMQARIFISDVAMSGVISISPSTISNLVDCRFTSFENLNGLLPFIQRLANVGGFLIAQTTHRMDHSRAQAIFNQDNVVQRGHFYCISGDSQPCNFRVPFTFDFSSREYMIKRDGLTLEHNHVATAIVVDNILFKQRNCELTAEEMELIMGVAPHTTIGGLRAYLKGKWPNVGYDSALLHRLKAKGTCIRYGDDVDAINKFMALGSSIIAELGIFDVHYEESMKIQEVLIQKASMRSYAQEYGDFTIVDGTFSISMYDLVLVVFSNVNCLMKMTLTGLLLALSEHSDSVIQAAKRFLLAKEGTVLMTDQASAFALVANELKHIHLLCLQHFRTAMFTAHSGMSQDVCDRFFVQCNHLLFSDCDSFEEFTRQYDQARVEFSNYPSALKYLDSLWEQQDKVCGTFTSTHFTAGHVPTQRGELNNARVKEGGQLKKDLSSFNLHQVLEHLLSIIRQQESESKKAIRLYIKAGRGWCMEVDNVWKSENGKASNYSCICVNTEDRVWEAKRFDGKGAVHTVHLMANSYPTCSCRSFTSTLIPCRAICAVYHHINDDLFTLATLHPRWWLKNHPQFLECLTKLGLAPKNSLSGLHNDSLVNSISPVADFHMKLVGEIRVPNAKQAQYCRLDEVAREIVSLGSVGDDFRYRFVMSKLASLVNDTKALRDDQPVPTAVEFGVLPLAMIDKQIMTENLSRC